MGERGREVGLRRRDVGERGREVVEKREGSGDWVLSCPPPLR